MKRAAIYMRVSSDKQAQEGDSIPAQREALHKFVNDRGLVFAGEYLDDGISGQKYSQRDDLQRLLDDVKAGKIDLICFTKLDRWFRSVRHYTATQEFLDRNHVDWIAIWEPIYDTTTPAGRLIVNQMMAIAQFEAENTGQRILQIFDYKVKRGEVLSGSTPPGYKIDNKHLVPDENAPSVVAAFEAYARSGSLNVTMRETEGLPGLPRVKPAYKNMLQNSKYIGVFRDNNNYCPALISRRLFEDVQRKLTMNVKKNQRYDYIFSGLLVCGECGGHLGANTRRRQRGNSLSIIHQYRCARAYQPLRLCKNRKLATETALEKYLLGRIRPDLEQIVLDAEAKSVPARSNASKIAALEKKIGKLKELFLSDLISLEEYKADKESYLVEIEALKAEEVEPPKDVSAIKVLLDSGIESFYKGSSPAEKRLFWRSIIKEIVFRGCNDIHVNYL